MAIVVEPVSIEPMRLSDMEDVLRIDKKCFPTPWLPSAFQTELSNRAASYLLARLGGEIVGFGGQWVIMGEMHITTLAVDPAHQGRKIGERLLLTLLEEGVLQGASRCTLEVREGNRAAQHLYRKYGFRNAAVRKNYYSDNGENATVMWADDIHTSQYKQFLRDMRQYLYQKYQVSSP